MCTGSGDTAAVERLLQLGCSMLAIDKIGWSPLMWAASGGHAATLRALMTAGADVRIRDVRLRGALHWAAEKGHVEAVGILVDSLSELQLDLHAQVCALPSLCAIAIRRFFVICKCSHQALVGHAKRSTTFMYCPQSIT